MTASTCDMCGADVPRCPGFGTYCQRRPVCGFYVVACERCTAEHLGSVQHRTAAAHDRKRHATEVGR